MILKGVFFINLGIVQSTSRGALTLAVDDCADLILGFFVLIIFLPNIAQIFRKLNLNVLSLNIYF